MKCLTNVLLAIVTVAAVGLAKPVFAYPGRFTSGIENTFVTSSTYFSQSPSGDFMVTLAGIHSCGSHQAFFYTVKTDPQYGNYVGLLEFARANQRHPTISYSTDAGGYCRITGVIPN
jgi:hypothetical protein